MNHKLKITFCLSFVLALLFSLPWITLIEQVRQAGFRGTDAPVLPRVIYMFFTVFIASVLLFAYNFFWKPADHEKQTYRTIQVILMNVLLIAGLSLLFVMLSNLIFDVRALMAYFMIYFFRILIIAVVVVLVVYVVELVERLKQEKIEVLMLQHQNTESELAVLKSQIDPHFLFNTLTTLSSLVRADSKETVSFVDHMADTFRYMLDNREQKVVAVRDELSFLQSYLFMMKKRFEEGFQVDLNIDAPHLDRMIPQFALQIVVENAMKHNIVSMRQPLRIELKSDDEFITVTNNVNEKMHSRGYGIGLDNLAQRYSLIGKQMIKVTRDAGFFKISLPLL